MIRPVTGAILPSDLQPTPAAVQVDAFKAAARDRASPQGLAMKAGEPAALAGHVADGLRGWQSNLADLDRMVGSVAQPSSLSNIPASDIAGNPLVPGTTPILGLMVKTFDFAMQTQLVARAATQFTGSLNSLMKSQ